jgi:DNA-binding IclR family transcriptional regulator
MSVVREKRTAVRSVDRAISILEFLSREGGSGVTEVANGLGVHKSTAHRLLATLKDRGLVEQDGDTELYHLGMGLVYLASSVTSSLDLVRAARPVCRELSEHTQETVTITVLVGDEALIIDQTSSPSSVLSVDWTGRRTPLHCTSDGKVLLAHLPASRQRRILAKPLERFTEHTIVEPALLLEQLQRVLIEGYGYTLEEFEIGLNAVAAPIYAAGGAVVAVLGLSGPAFRLPVTAIPALGEMLMEAARTISQQLGYQGEGGKGGAVRKASWNGLSLAAEAIPDAV